ncbi:MAG: class I tRNA ligase family protein, partial [Nitrospirota bacterium]|nr:class I tRNA ligase family protein [Nitrospirota bacterium]
PTSVLVTGFDIIFFWVARMIMMGLKFMGDVPFRHVYIHALVRDIRGQKMSKSRGNVVDPLKMMDRYGTDAFRFTLAAFAAQGRDIKFSEDRVEGYRHFVNKLWNAARFILMNYESHAPNFKPDSPILISHSLLSRRWIMSRLAATADEMNRALAECRFNDAANSIYQFMWHEFCDWYIEMAKPELQNQSVKNSTMQCLLSTLDLSLRLLHPFMPYVTEEIWQKIPHVNSKKEKVAESIMISHYPGNLPRDHKAEEEMSYVMDAITGVRTIRGELNVPPSVKLNVSIKTHSQTIEKILNENVHYIKVIANIAELEIGMNVKKPGGSATFVKSSMEIYVLLKGILNVEAEVVRLKKDETEVERTIILLNKKLVNEDFLQRAPREVIEKEKVKYEEMRLKRERIVKSIEKLKEVGGEK